MPNVEVDTIFLYFSSAVQVYENMLAVHFLGEDQWDAWNLFVVFLLEPISRETFKLPFVCSEGEWDDFIAIIVTEIWQCYLFVYFAYDKETAWLVFVGIALIQVLLAFFKIQYKGTWFKGSAKSCGHACKVYFRLILTEALLNVSSLIFLTFNEDSLFRRKWVEMIIAGSIALVTMQQEMHAINDEKLGAPEEHENRDARDLAVQIYTLADNRMFVPHMIAQACQIVLLGMAWSYLFSDEIEEGWETIYTWIYCIITTLVLPCTMCLPCCCRVGVLGLAQNHEEIQKQQNIDPNKKAKAVGSKGGATA